MRVIVAAALMLSFARYAHAQNGRLTWEQVQSGMPPVARNFTAIDTPNQGYVTLDENRGYNQARHAARAAKSQ